MKVVILAAGYATRLYPLTIDKPKCLLTVGSKTILDTIVEKISVLKAIDEIVIVTNDRFYSLLTRWNQASSHGVKISIFNDGTTSNENRIGAVADFDFALKQAGIQNEDVLLLASDNLFDESLSGFIDFCKKHSGDVSVAVYDLGNPQFAAGKYGVLELDGKNQVINIEEKPAAPKSGLVGMGLYYFPAKTLMRVKEYLNLPDAKDAPGFFIRWLFGSQPIFAYCFGGLWYDIGDLKSLEEANKIFITK